MKMRVDQKGYPSRDQSDIRSNRKTTRRILLLLLLDARILLLRYPHEPVHTECGEDVEDDVDPEDSRYDVSIDGM
jgi:hypothetical protein